MTTMKLKHFLLILWNFWLLHFKFSICIPILHACIFTVKDDGSMFFQNPGSHLPSYMVSDNHSNHQENLKLEKFSVLTFCTDINELQFFYMLLLHVIKIKCNLYIRCFSVT